MCMYYAIYKYIMHIRTYKKKKKKTIRIKKYYIKVLFFGGTGCHCVC